MAESKPDKEREKAEELGVVTNQWLDMLKEHGVYWLVMFFFGLVCGGAFGWPLFTSNHKTNSRRGGVKV